MILTRGREAFSPEYSEGKKDGGEAGNERVAERRGGWLKVSFRISFSAGVKRSNGENGLSRKGDRTFLTDSRRRETIDDVSLKRRRPG